MTVNKTVLITGKLGKPIAEIKEYLSYGQYNGSIISCRDFKPLGDHFLKTDNIHLYSTKSLRTGQKTILAFLGDARNGGQYITQGVDNVKKLILSIKQGIHVNLYSEQWHKQVFKK